MEQKSGAEEWSRSGAEAEQKRSRSGEEPRKDKLKIDRSKRGSKIILVEIKISKIKNHGY